MTFEQWLSANRHELRIRYGNEHLGAMKAEEYQVWLHEQYAIEHPTVTVSGSRT